MSGRRRFVDEERAGERHDGGGVAVAGGVGPRAFAEAVDVAAGHVAVEAVQRQAGQRVAVEEAAGDAGAGHLIEAGGVAVAAGEPDASRVAAQAVGAAAVFVGARFPQDVVVVELDVEATGAQVGAVDEHELEAVVVGVGQAALVEVDVDPVDAERLVPVDRAAAVADGAAGVHRVDVGVERREHLGGDGVQAGVDERAVARAERHVAVVVDEHAAVLAAEEVDRREEAERLGGRRRAVVAHAEVAGRERRVGADSGHQQACLERLHAGAREAREDGRGFAAAAPPRGARTGTAGAGGKPDVIRRLTTTRISEKPCHTCLLWYPGAAFANPGGAIGRLPIGVDGSQLHRGKIRFRGLRERRTDRRQTGQRETCRKCSKPMRQRCLQ